MERRRLVDSRTLGCILKGTHAFCAPASLTDAGLVLYILDVYMGSAEVSLLLHVNLGCLKQFS